MQCAYHPDREPVGACVACGRLICIECKAVLGGKIYCSPCADKIFVHGKTEPPKSESIDSARQQQKIEAQASAIKTQPEPVFQPASNTSGQGAASVLPEELKGWNWGAFFLNWIWGIGNNVWIALLAFILGLIWAIVLGIKGNEWAWQHKKWDSIEHFQSTQRKWKRWGVGLFIVVIVLTIIVVLITVVLAIMGKEIQIGS
jgi:hypothetical protein